MSISLAFINPAYNPSGDQLQSYVVVCVARHLASRAKIVI